jgi:hypothetical protein
MDSRSRTPRVFRAGLCVAAVGIGVLIAPGRVAAQQFFSIGAPPPVAFPTDAVVHDPTVRITTPYMYLDGGGNPRVHDWFVVADSSGTLTITVQAGVDACCVTGSGTITASVFTTGPGAVQIAGPITVLQPASPPAGHGSMTVATTPGAQFRMSVSSPGGAAPFLVYRLKLDGAGEAQPANGIASVAGAFASGKEGTRWVMNVAAGESLDFSVLPGGPANPCVTPPPCPVVIAGTEVRVFDPNHGQRLPLTSIAASGSALSIPDAGDTPGAWAIVVVQPSNNPSQHSPYRLVKSSGLDPGVYSAWSTDGKATVLDVTVYSPPAVTTVDLTLSADVFTGYGGFGTSGSQTHPIATNQTLHIQTPDTGQYHATVAPPPGYTAVPSQMDVPITSDDPTTVVVYIRDATPPDIHSVTPTTGTLWPPNHKMVPISVTMDVSDFIDPAPACSLTAVSSSEPEEGLGDGDERPDWTITGPLSVDLRSERSGLGTGRTYTITLQCVDASGNTATKSAIVTVPHDLARD